MIAPQDGVLGLTLDVPASEVAALPDRVPIRLGADRTLEATIAVLAPPTFQDHALLRRAAWPDAWTRPPGAVDVLRPSDARAAGRAGVAIALVRTPADAEGPVTLGDTTLDVVWRPWRVGLGDEPAPGREQPRLALEARPDRPDPSDPRAWWRWVLLADAFGWRAPEPPGEAADPARLLAEREAARWRMALARLSADHPGVASALRDRLTTIVTVPETSADDAARAIVEGPGARVVRLAGRRAGDPPPAVAAWWSDAAAVETVLGRLLDPGRPVRRTATEVVLLLDAIEPVLAWPGPPADPAAGADMPAIVHLANRGLAPERVRVGWEGTTDGARTLELPPLSLIRLEMTRPRRETAILGPERSGDEAGPDEAPAGTDAARPGPAVLLVTDQRSGTRRLPVLPPTLPARPPGADLTPVRAWTLDALERGAWEDGTPSAGFAMSARLRRIDGRWEVFVESRRPAGSEGDGVRLWLGPEGGGGVLHIPETGATSWRPAAGSPPASEAAGAPSARTTPAPLVERRSWEDRWYARIVIPPRWTVGDRLDLAVSRHLRDGRVRLTSPGPALPWREDPGRLRFDLRTWDE